MKSNLGWRHDSRRQEILSECDPFLVESILGPVPIELMRCIHRPIGHASGGDRDAVEGMKGSDGAHVHEHLGGRGGLGQNNPTP